MSSSEKWSDLATRVGSGLAMVFVGALCIWMGGLTFHLLVAVICGLMVWELVGMLRPNVASQQLLLGLLTGVVLLSSAYIPASIGMLVLAVPVLVGLGLVPQQRALYAVFAVLIILSGISLMLIRDTMGVGWMLWLAFVVVITDVVGYFAGRAFGGPKFWPAISPKKTWSGTAAGWVGAAIVGFAFSLNTGSGLSLVWISIAVSMASQMGDIIESALKRKMGIKDSSNLIPGHGGLMDRFDGMLGASVFLLLVVQVIGFPAGLG
ncbi:phosphatidate cytidylyltransferase [Sulfitobacter donghicola]|uniref:Phosphatidate cytidylyltransferase n=1 Tax=Sulfitobacter donghicola DSW-25 = KCTC 12864 = JCM 14565 TaxID=1300350 RepID=A0A073IDB6_9RHOB|nr:phosphatidate cytidylyltransferase [Sulfitobacter donghicola]KEJ88363.1 phosphatidate cytidylyltransferase [Sulfitobacter donghicola DSW-25 = KCTC 12864 = JCM 14565]KIN69773.1 Phosphatidate cytidylyltransferase [Sulfitobacter donghicola DSW-25 = KCTC 12864 = JCM 14565]